MVINDDLKASALKLTGTASKVEVVELGLRALVRLKQQEAVRAFNGKLPCRERITEGKVTK